MSFNHDPKTCPACQNLERDSGEHPRRELASSDLLKAFGEKCLDDLLQGEWEPDWEWQQERLEEAERMGLIRKRAVTERDDVPEEYDFIYERL